MRAPGLERMLLGMRVGGPHGEVLGAWLTKDRSGTCTALAHLDDAELPLDRAIAGCAADQVGEVRTLARPPAHEIPNRHRPGASNGPTEGSTCWWTKVKAGHGFRSFVNHRLRILLHAGGVRRPPMRPLASCIRTRSPR